MPILYVHVRWVACRGVGGEVGSSVGISPAQIRRPPVRDWVVKGKGGQRKGDRGAKKGKGKGKGEKGAKKGKRGKGKGERGKGVRRKEKGERGKEKG